MKKLLLFSAAAICALSGMAQDKPTATVWVEATENVTLPYYYISPDGAWAAGEFMGFAYRMNLNTHEYEEYYDELYPGTAALDIMNDGTAVGRYGADIGAPAAIWPLGVTVPTPWTMLPVPDGCLPNDNCPQGVTGDGMYICGYAYTEGGTYVPVVWTRQDDGTYSYEILPYPEEDLWGMMPQMAICQCISEDGKRIAGRFVDYTGYCYFGIVWNKDEAGAWTYQLLGEDYVIIGEENPGPQPLIEDYVTAEEGTDEYTQQVNEFELAMLDWWMYAEQYARLATSAQQRISTSPDGMSPNGRWLCLGTPAEGRIYDLNDYTFKAYTGIGGPTAVDNDGTAYFANGMLGAFTAYIVPAGETEPVQLSQWLRDNYEIVTEEGSASELPDDIGSCRVSGDGKTIVGWRALNEISAANTIIKLSETSGVDAVAMAQEVTLEGTELVVPEGSCEVAIYDVAGKTLATFTATGRTDLAGYADGFVLIKAGQKVFKAIL